MFSILSPSLLRQYVIVTIVNFVSLTTGINIIWSSPMLVKLRNGTDTPLSRPITEEEGSWIVSGGYLAAVATNFLAGLLIDRIGRKYCIILATVPRICASIWTIFANEVWMLIICRAVMVLTDCYIFVVVPVYVSEIACKEHRGSLGTFLHLFSCAGIVITYGVGPYVGYTTLNVVLATSTVLSTIPIPFLPDTPVYLYSKGRIDEAIKVLSNIRASDAIVRQELEEYNSSKQVKINKMALLKDKIFLKSLALSMLLCVGSNVVGYSSVSFYLQTVLESTHTKVQPEIVSVINGVIQFLAALSSSFLNNIFGRRPILISTTIGVGVGMIGLGVFFTFSSREGYEVVGFLNYLPLISIIICTYCFNVGIGCLIFVVTAELFEGPARAIGVTICFWLLLLVTFFTSKYFVEMNTAMGPAETFWFFTVMCILLATLIAIFLPETKGKKFSEIQIMLGRKPIKTENEEPINYKTI